ncbi:MAG: sensor histidine kinase KdpD [Firmicutes bacterium]|nr:sensor histidine kinase KdpD [Bacillota bacterium]
MEEEARHRGRLKIFFGYAAGVGKTYAMLEAARQRKNEGADVVVGYVETHGRKETEALLDGLEIIPRRRVPYRNVALEEMDLDAILERRPELVLVDELAHTNAPGSRHLKRYQDVEELLSAGIHVYTTLNVQHLESFNDVVAQITGIRVRETVPDRIFDKADEIELIDLPPEELLQRLKEGKVYIPEQAERAIRKFFRPGNLLALRELALRRTAQRVDRQMRAYMVTHGIPGPWPAAERVLVCLGPTPMAEQLVRTAHRLAAHLDAEWFALHVDTPADRERPPAEQDLVRRALRLAEELGGKAVTVPGLDVAAEIIHYAKAHNITKIVLGKSPGSRWREVLRTSIVDHILQHSDHVDVHIISARGDAFRRTRWRVGRTSGTLRGVLAGSALVAAVTVAGHLALGHIVPVNLVMFYLLAVVIAGLCWGQASAVVASLLGVLAFDYFFVPPRLSFGVSDAQYLITFAGLLTVALTVGSLTGRLREQVELARQRERENAMVYDLTRALVAAQTVDEIARIVVRELERSGWQAAVLLPDGGALRAVTASPGLHLDDKENAAANWTYRYGQPSGRGEKTLPGTRARYLPLRGGKGVLGTLAVAGVGEAEIQSPGHRRVLDALAAQVATAIERAQLAEEARRAQLASEAERLYAILLNSVSHDLRTPLATIIGALSALTRAKHTPADPEWSELLETAREEADRLNRLVGNLLDITRLQAGRPQLLLDWCDLEDVVSHALEQMTPYLKDRPVRVLSDAGLPLVRADQGLMTQVLINLLDNAAKYSPPGSPIEISLRKGNGEVHVQIADRGQGIPEQHRERVFEKFYRVEQPGSPPGTGLGLAICKTAVEAHGGHIWLEPRPRGGTVVTFSLPAARGKEVEQGDDTHGDSAG